ncbi:MAG TPA: lamin tail domain-containing protein [Roseiflexaceae bacterium]|nr:lamin tail domain-containing protein [Roseiflexaceae bacterium]
MKRTAFLLALLAAALLLPTAGRAQTAERCFPETGYCISGRIREFWEQNGGLPVFGFPIGPQEGQAIEGQVLQVQWFERNRLELHPENARPYDVLLGRLGADRLAQQGRDPFTFPRSEPLSDCRFFAETGHNVCGEVLAAWRASGLELDGRRGKTEGESLGLFGLPLSDLQTETLGDGRQYQVQWFERARFEIHPENQPPYNVLLGLLGGETRTAAPAPDPAVPPTQPPPPAQPDELPPSFNNCQEDPNALRAPNRPVAIVAVDKRGETVRLQNNSGEPVSLEGWRMCSIKGNQEHSPIGGTLAPGEARDFSNSGGNIWNNSEPDNGALYDAAGRLVSYWVDR